MLEGRVVLEHEPDAAVLRAPSGHLLVGDVHGSGVRPLQPGDAAQERRLPRAGRPEEGDERPGRDFERHVLERDEVAEPLRHVADDDAHVASFGRRTFISTSVRIAISASTSDELYAPTVSKFS